MKKKAEEFHHIFNDFVPLEEEFFLTSRATSVLNESHLDFYQLVL
jgi:hypothetical protein